MNWLIYLTYTFHLAPMFYLRPEIVTNSGFPRKDYPLLHEIFYDRNWQICLSIMCFVFVIFVISLRKSSLKYQFNNFAAAVIFTILIAAGI
jgi:hypothetical protein